MAKLNIQDLSKLKITTVKPWAVNFTYDGEQYFLHDDSDEDRCMGLYHKINGRESERINGKITLYCPHDYIKLKKGKFKWGQNKASIVYKHIDLEYFVKKLTLDGIIDSYYNEECKEIKNRIDIKQNEIKELRDKIYKIEQDIKKLEA